jgi:hypothetical protein
MSRIMSSEINETRKLANKGHSAGKGWWIVRFRMKWPENTDPSWHIDLLLAHTILAPVLKKHRQSLGLWRFHRRAARDQEGHQFSFLFYASQHRAQNINDSVLDNKTLRKMKRSGIVTQDIYDNTDILRPDIAATSDPHWSPLIRKSWPHFIAGVCQMWLTMIDEISTDLSPGKTSASLPQLIRHYEEVNNKLADFWQKEGGHALLHHLNAIFGYVPVMVNEVRLARY